MMRGGTILTAIAVAAATACGTNEAGPAGPADRGLETAGGPVVEWAGGGGSMTLEVFGFTIPQTLGFTAKRHADGTVRGQIQYHQVFEGERLTFHANVTCMEIYDGNRVKFGGEITKSNDPDFPPGGYIWFHSIDNGQGAGAPPDRSTGSGFGTEAENEAFCASPAPPNPIFLADLDGNIQVVE